MDRRSIYEVLYRDSSEQEDSADFMASFLFSSIVYYRKSLSRARWNLNKAQNANNASEVEELAETEGPASESCAVSVIIPLLETQKHFSECLDSLLAQTLESFEVIVIDGTDGFGAEVVAQYAERFGGRLKLVQTEEPSVNAKRNFGLNLARGDYVLFFDANDFLLPDALKFLREVAAANEADVVYTSSRYELRQPTEARVSIDGEARDLLKANQTEEPALNAEPAQNLERLLNPVRQVNFSNAQSHFVRRELLEANQIVFPDTSAGADLLWCIDVRCNAKRLLRLPKPLWFARGYIVPTAQAKPNEAQALAEFVTALSTLADKNDLLKTNPADCHDIARNQFNRSLGTLKADSSPEEVYRNLEGRADAVSSIVPFFLLNILRRKKNVAALQKSLDEAAAPKPRSKRKE